MTAVASRKYGSLVWEDSVIGGSAFRNFIRSLSALEYCLFHRSLRVLGAFGSLVWEDSIIGGSAFRNFIRSLSALKYCLFLLMHTVHTYSSVPFKETVRKRELFRSRLYEQLRRRPKHRFPHNRILYKKNKRKRVKSSQETNFSPAAKSAPRA